MKVIPQLKELNRFRLVHIPSNAEFFQRFGYASPVGNQQYTGDTPAEFSSRKVDMISRMDALNAEHLSAEFERESTSKDSEK